MKNNDLKSILADIAEEALPGSDIDLLPALTGNLAEEKLQNETSKRSLYQLSLIRRTALMVLALILTFAIVLITPQGRAFAQRLFSFFSTAESESFPLAEEQLNLFVDTPTPAPTFALALETVSVSNSEPLEAIPDPIPTSSSADDILKDCKDALTLLSYSCQIAHAESQVQFDAREFPEVPRGFAFVNAQSNTTLHSMTINYQVVEGGGYLTLNQGLGTMYQSSSSWGAVPGNAVERIQVGHHYGEFAQGQFVVKPGATSATWEPNAAVLRLRWSEGDRWFSLEKMGNTAPIEYLDKDALIALAASLVSTPASDAIISIDNIYQMSIAEAETTAGFDLLEPMILPAEFEFAYARYDAAYQIVMLFYLPKGQDAGVGGCKECPTGVVEQLQVNGMTAYYWQGIFDAGSAEQPLSPPVWRADAPEYTLMWATSDLIVELYYSQTEWYGGQLSKHDLVRIAESMQ
jgi:hypothetical protein